MSSISTITGSGGGGGGGIMTINGDTGSITGSTVTIFADNSALNCGSSVLFANSGTTSTFNVTDSSGNTIIGKGAGNASVGGNSNTAIGTTCFLSASGATFNECLGYGSFYNLSSGSFNVALGSYALDGLLTGEYNVGIGYTAGSNYGGAEANNICINSSGVAAEGNALHVGAGTGTDTQELNQAFICGIQTIVVTGTPVLVSTGDQLGVATSSRRFKNDIQDMAADSSASLKLRPVTYTINKESAPGLKNATDERQFGLIAEEVAEVMPSLVNYVEGKPFSVKYEHLPAILLNELQKALKRIDLLEAKLGSK